MSSNLAIQTAADALRLARDKRETIARISETHGISGAQEAYAVAEINTKARLAQGRRIVGKKVGLTSLAVQKQLGVDQPDFGVLFDDMEFLSGQEVPMTRLIQPKVDRFDASGSCKLLHHVSGDEDLVLVLLRHGTHPTPGG